MVNMKIFERLMGEKVLICPRCKSKLNKLKKNNVVIDICPSCHGIWLDDGEIEKLVTKVKKK